MAEWQGFYSTSQVSRLARVPRSTLYDWKATGILKPSVRVIDGDTVVDEGYSYADLTIIRLSRAIRDKKLNMHERAVNTEVVQQRAPLGGGAVDHDSISGGFEFGELIDQFGSK